MMNKNSGKRRMLTIALVMSFVFCVSYSANAQEGSGLTSQAAMSLLSEDSGKWAGTRIDYSSGLEESETKVIVVNRMEAGKWLYFQIAENDGGDTSLSKGTLEFDPESGTFIRRWFESGDAEIKQAKVEYDAESEVLRFSMVAPSTTPVPDSDGFEFDTDDELAKEGRLTVVLSARDADTRVVKTYLQNDLTDATEGTLSSELVLSRVKVNKKKPTAKAKNVTNKKAAPKKKAEPVTHVLRVTVLVGSVRLQTGQKPELTISPDEGIKVLRTSGDTFEFTGLKSGEEYSVVGNYKLTTGFGLDTKGETTPFAIPKDSTAKITQTKVLRLEQ